MTRDMKLGFEIYFELGIWDFELSPKGFFPGEKCSVCL